jgi:hypothetical protein
MHFGSASSAFGSPEQMADRGPFNPPQPHAMPAKSAMRHSRRPTMDEFGSPLRGPQEAFAYPQAGPTGIIPPAPYRYRQTPMAPQQHMLSPMMFPPQQPPIAMQMPPPNMQMPPPNMQMPPPNMPIPGYSMPPSVMATPMQMPGPNQYPSSRSRRHRRRHDSEDEEEEGIIPRGRPAPVSGMSNPLPQPPRVLPVPAVSPAGSILVDSPPAPPREKPPPNPLPVPPKAVISTSQTSRELEAAAEEVKRAKDRTEHAKAKAIARLEADTWRAAGVPIAETEGDPVVPLIPGVTVPGVLPNARREPTTQRDEGSHHHNPLSSLLKRMSTRHRTNPSGEPPPVAPKPPRRDSRPPPPRPPPMPTHNSGDMPMEDAIIPRSSKRGSAMPFITNVGPVVNGQQFVIPHNHRAQVHMRLDPATGEYFDPTSGLRWDPTTRKYYHKQAGIIPPLGRKNEKDRGSGSLMSMIKRWTTNTAPDDQPKAITTQLVLPSQPGATAGLKGVKAVGTVPPFLNRQPRMSQQPPARIFEDTPKTGPRRRTLSASESRRPWDFPRGPSDNGISAINDSHPWTPAGQSASRVPSANIYFSRKRDAYGGFRLDSDHPVIWAGIAAFTALNWFESGKFERPGTGLGAGGLESGATFPSRMQPTHGNDTRRSFLRGIMGRSDQGIKNAKLEYASARTQESDFILKLKDRRQIDHTVAEFRMSGRERHDWDAIWRYKVRIVF